MENREEGKILRCNRCGADFVGNFCPNCGAPANQPIQATGQIKPPARKKGLKTWQIVLITLGCVIGAPIVLLTVVSMVIGIQTAVDVFGESSSSTSYSSAIVSSSPSSSSYSASIAESQKKSNHSASSSYYSSTYSRYNPYVEVTAKELVEAFAENQVSADKNIRGKSLK